jgi:polysaccharide export outer membrane protein
MKISVFISNTGKSIAGVMFMWILLLVFLNSCTIIRPSYVFSNVQRDTTINLKTYQRTALKIAKKDVLNIHVSSLNKEEDDVYNAIGRSSNEKLNGFALNASGEIIYHKLGRVKAEGLTCAQLMDTLERKLIPYLRDPVVTVRFANHYVTVMGEVQTPARIGLEDEGMTLLDALAQTGKTMENSNLEKLLLIRDIDSARVMKTLNLQDYSILNSEFYYLQPNDIVVVPTNEKKLISEQKRGKLQQASQISFQVITALLVIYQTFFR